MNETNASVRTARFIAFLVRIAAGIVAVGCFLAGLWSVFSHPAQGFALMGLGIVVGIAFGRVRTSAGKAHADEK
jgi:hypothetical protein